MIFFISPKLFKFYIAKVTLFPDTTKFFGDFFFIFIYIMILVYQYLYTFVKSKSATWDVTGEHGIPEGWTVETI